MNRRNLAIGAGVAVLIVLVWYFALWAPRSKTIKKEKARAETAEQTRNNARTEVARLRAAQRDEPANRAKLEGLRTAIPDQPNLAQFILDTNDAAVRAGIDFISVAPALPALPSATPGAAAVPPPTLAPAPGTGAATVGATAPAEIKIQLQVMGGYFQVLDFVNRLDAMPRLVMTDTLNLTADPNGRLTVTASLRMFLTAVPAEYGGPAAAATATTTTVPGGATTTTVAGGAAATTSTIAGATTSSTVSVPS